MSREAGAAQGVVAKALEKMYDTHHSHIDFVENMNGGDCDCRVHADMRFLAMCASVVDK